MKAEYVEHMGSDLTVVNSARVSFDKHHSSLDTGDERLIHYLARNGHWTPFSHAVITLRENIPIFVARQRIRHAVGFTYNEVSRRYVDNEPEYFEPVWRERAENKKQGSAGKLDDQRSPDTIYWRVISQMEDAYLALLKAGICPEQARMVLPLSSYTSWYVTGSLAAWARAYTQRIHPHAQKEIQELAKQWDTIIRPLYPISWSALVDTKEEGGKPPVS